MKPRHALAAPLAAAAVLTCFAAMPLVGPITGPAARAAEAPAKRLAYLGAALKDLSPGALREAGARNGVVIVAIDPGSPADHEGLLEGDIITEFEGQPVHHAYEVYGKIRTMRIGELARVRVWRDGRERAIMLIPLGGIEPGPRGEASTVSGQEERIARLESQVAALERRVAALERGGGKGR